MQSERGIRQVYQGPASHAGLAMIGVAGLISTISTLVLLIYLHFPSGRLWTPWRASSDLHRGITAFARSTLGICFTCVMVSDLIQGIGFISNFRWAVDSKIEVGPVCLFQGFVTQVGDVGGALFSFMITIHTFIVIFLHKRPSSTLVFIGISFVWSLILFLPILGKFALERPDRNPFFGPSGTGYCWIGFDYQLERFFFLWFFVYVSLAFSIILYTLVYLSTIGRVPSWLQPSALRRSRSISPDAFWVTYTTEALTGLQTGKPMGLPKSAKHYEEREQYATSGWADDNISDSTKKIAARMLWYPVAYMVAVIPISVCRFRAMRPGNPSMPLWYSFIAAVCFASSGTINVVLWYFTRGHLIARAAPRIIFTTTTTIAMSSSIPLKSPDDFASYNQKDARRADALEKSDVGRVVPVDMPFHGPGAIEITGHVLSQDDTDDGTSVHSRKSETRHIKWGQSTSGLSLDSDVDDKNDGSAVDLVYTTRR